MARAVFEGVPHHVTQRGNGRAQTFFCDEDYRLYRDLLAQNAAKTGVEVWAWALMPNHVHLILVPPDPDALRRCLAPAHRRYAGHIHAREQRTGHFWQGRFGCVALDEAHLVAAVRYVVLNPVRAGLAARAADWRWSSLHAHLQPERGDGLTRCGPVHDRFPDFAGALASGEDEALSARLRRAETIGRPLGTSEFIAALEARADRRLSPVKRGPKPKISALSP
jgi:putative transposase